MSVCVICQALSFFFLTGPRSREEAMEKDEDVRVLHCGHECAAIAWLSEAYGMQTASKSLHIALRLESESLRRSL